MLLLKSRYNRSIADKKTNIYTIRIRILEPPTKKYKKFLFISPMLPQLNAPKITRKKAVLSIILSLNILIPP